MAYALTVIALLVFVLGSKVHAADGDGYLIVSLGCAENSSYVRYQLHYRRIGESAADTVEYAAGNSSNLTGLLLNRLFDRKPDYKGDGEGIVEVRKLPPGDYEFYNYDVYASAGMFSEHWWSRNDFHLPFRIVAEQATYIGNFTAVDGGSNLVHFLIFNKSARDLPIAKTKVPALPEPQIAIVVEQAANAPLTGGGR
ncbi:MAG: hypothetical protein HY243_19335 [Proteobacteria bacterium]|nr:hypothetical protein [Pseudomonadota bacterium]